MENKDICFQCEQEDIILEKDGVCSHCDYLNRRNDYENKVVEITKDNIHLYYEFMSDGDLIYYQDIVFDFILNRKMDVFINLFGGNIKIIDLPKCENFVGSSGVVLKYSLFGITDTLKPIDEYIEEIKSSEEYKNYIAKDFIEVFENIPKLNNKIKSNKTMFQILQSGGCIPLSHCKKENLKSIPKNRFDFQRMIIKGNRRYLKDGEKDSLNLHFGNMI